MYFETFYSLGTDLFSRRDGMFLIDDIFAKNFSKIISMKVESNSKRWFIDEILKYGRNLLASSELPPTNQV
jgi:hypothetical protein